jgi:hypothetical protein
MVTTMAVTHGHGNPNWTRDEVLLALELYLRLQGQVPGPSDTGVIALSQELRRLPYHASAARKPSFRNPDAICAVVLRRPTSRNSRQPHSKPIDLAGFFEG